MLEQADHLANSLAPVISFISAVLVYLAFREQVKANNKIQSQIEKQGQEVIFFRQMDVLEKLLNDYEITDDSKRLFGGKILHLYRDKISHSILSKAKTFFVYQFKNYKKSIDSKSRKDINSVHEQVLKKKINLFSLSTEDFLEEIKISERYGGSIYMPMQRYLINFFLMPVLRLEKKFTKRYLMIY